MKIWMAHPRLDRRGGAENLIESLSRALAVRGHAVSVAALRFDGRAWPDSAWRGVALHSLHARSDRFLPRAMRQRARARRLARLTAGADAVVAHNFPAALWVAECAQSRRVWYCHEPSERLHGGEVFPTLTAAGAAEPSAYTWAEGAFARELVHQRTRRPRVTRLDCALDVRAVAQLDGVLANSAFTAGAVSRIYELPAVVCHPGVDVAAAPPAAEVQPPYVAWVTNPRVAKNAVGFLAALRLALEQEPGLAVRAVGLDAKLRERVRTCGLASVVTALDPLDDARYAELLAGARLVAVPSIDEPFGLVVLEAMAHARAVLASNQGGPAESVVAGVTGVHVDPLDPAAIARELVALWRDPARCAALGRAGRVRYEREFTLTRFTDRFIDAIS